MSIRLLSILSMSLIYSSGITLYLLMSIFETILTNASSIIGLNMILVASICFSSNTLGPFISIVLMLSFFVSDNSYFRPVALTRFIFLSNKSLWFYVTEEYTFVYQKQTNINKNTSYDILMSRVINDMQLLLNAGYLKGAQDD